MTNYEIVSLVVSIISLVASIAVSISIHVVSRRIENKQYDLTIENEARKFIIDQGDSEIRYLPLCLMACTTNRHRKHIRAIYNKFNALPNDIQERVLKLAGYEFNPSWRNFKTNQVNELLEEVEEFAKNYDLGNTFLYEGAKYFNSALLYYPDSKISNYHELEPLFEDKLDFCSAKAKTFRKDLISFSSYFESYYETFVLKKESNEELDVPKPLDYLAEIKKLKTCDEEELCFWMMIIVKELSQYLIRTKHGENLTYELIAKFICNRQ